LIIAFSARCATLYLGRSLLSIRGANFSGPLTGSRRGLITPGKRAHREHEGAHCGRGEHGVIRSAPGKYARRGAGQQGLGFRAQVLGVPSEDVRGAQGQFLDRFAAVNQLAAVLILHQFCAHSSTYLSFLIGYIATHSLCVGLV
jgi:hypothetical protein